MIINKHYVKVALKMMGGKKRKELAKLSKEEFTEKVRSNPKAKDISDDMIDAMYKELIRMVDKK